MRISCLVLVIAVPFSFPAIADDGGTAFTKGNLTGDIGFGSLSGKTKERVYDPDSAGHKNSQLDWKYSNAAIIKGSIEWNLIDRISIGATGWTTIASRGGYMEDTDWLDDSKRGWTDKSKHPNTRLNYANEFDLNAKAWFLKEQTYRIGMMAGYQESRYSFKSTGGTFDYTDGETGLNNSGAFPAGTTVIGYKQRFRMPYIGLIANYQYKRFELGGGLKYSGWVRTSDNDEHYLTNTTFTGNIKNQNYYSISGNAGYYLTPNTKIYLEGAWQRVTNKKGRLSANNYGTGERNSADNASGIENYSFMTTAGLKYVF